MRPAIVLLSAGGRETARRCAAILDGEVHGLRPRLDGVDVAFEETVAHLRALFDDGRPIVGLCAAGIPIRALADRLTDKRAEPPVVVVSEDGAVAVPLLGGHRGANGLAQRLADGLGGVAAITTAGDVRFGVALDAPPDGYVLTNPADAKPVMAALLAGKRARIEGDAPWLAGSALPLAMDAAIALKIADANIRGDSRTLVYAPLRIAVGVGCERGCHPEELKRLVEATLRDANVAPEAVAVVASLDLKSDEPAVHAAAKALGRPARFFDAATLEAETPRLANPSDIVFRDVGCHGVAEAAALAAVGCAGELVAPKRKSTRATCAAARAPTPIEAVRVGRPRGCLSIVGTGPGMSDWRTPEADRSIAAADDLIGYGLYLDLLGPLADGKCRHEFPLGQETERVHHALTLAAEGRDVALVSSGDPGIYALASLVFERIESGPAEWARAAIRVAPGISALQAAAARAGAPLGHDFCTISLSDLLTPWAAIERRIRAAAAGDFVIAFYNPVSRRRDWQLAKARDILLRERPADTPVVLAGNLGRAQERVRVVTLESLAPAEVDMLTLVLIGSTQTRAVARGDGGVWVYTPRGYAAKRDLEQAAG